MSKPSIEIIGSGVAGLCSAVLFSEHGCKVTVRSASNALDASCCSWWAGGMLAPWCEMESAEPLVGILGAESIEFWKRYSTGTLSNGSLVIAQTRDLPDLQQFSSRTSHYERVNGGQIEALVPDLAGRFSAGLYFADECHLDPRHALCNLISLLERSPLVEFRFNESLSPEQLAEPSSSDWRMDCRGLAARDVLPDLRGVRGEMLLLHTPEIALPCPVRLLHPRYPLYVVPRSDHVFMVGATTIESDHRGAPSARSLMELLSAAYALHPAFAEATVCEMGADARPAFTDNLPRLRRRGKTLYINGLYRHGFLCAPAMARRALDMVLYNTIDETVVDENND